MTATGPEVLALASLEQAPREGSPSPHSLDAHDHGRESGHPTSAVGGRAGRRATFFHAMRFDRANPRSLGQRPFGAVERPCRARP